MSRQPQDIRVLHRCRCRYRCSPFSRLPYRCRCRRRCSPSSRLRLRCRCRRRFASHGKPIRYATVVGAGTQILERCLFSYRRPSGFGLGQRRGPFPPPGSAPISSSTFFSFRGSNARISRSSSSSSSGMTGSSATSDGTSGEGWKPAR